MLSSEIIKIIEDFVYLKPRNIQEIAHQINRNWRTANRYVNEIEKEFGTISTRVFREGTRGALKIVYWSSMEKVSNSIFQEKFEEQIMIGRTKYDFSAFDIYQYIKDKDKRVSIEKAKDEAYTNLKELGNILTSAEKQILVFSGNLSFINLKYKDVEILKILDYLVKKGVNIKVICRIDIAGIKNIEKLLSLNFKYGRQLIEVRHREQPLRALVIDKKLFRIKEIKDPTGKVKELANQIFIFYNIKDKEWTEWITRIFWKMFSSSIDAHKRLNELNKIKV